MVQNGNSARLKVIKAVSLRDGFLEVFTDFYNDRFGG